MTPNEKHRFDAKVIEFPNGCHVWIGAIGNSGYGKLGIGGAGGKTVSAHRLSFEHVAGPIPHGQFVLHRCDDTRCVNPTHLFLGTHTDNMRDMRAKGRARRGNGRAPGERNGQAKLTDDAVRAMRAERSSGLTYAQVAAHHGVSRATASRACTGEAWRHV